MSFSLPEIKYEYFDKDKGGITEASPIKIPKKLKWKIKESFMRKIFNWIFCKVESNIPYSLFLLIFLGFVVVSGIALFIAYLGQKYNF